MTNLAEWFKKFELSSTTEVAINVTSHLPEKRCWVDPKVLSETFSFDYTSK